MMLETDTTTQKVFWAEFSDVFAQTVAHKNGTWGDFCARLCEPIGATKKALPLVKLALFGTTQSQNGSLRQDANTCMVTGVEGDYDAGAVSLEEAVGRLERAQLRAVVTTTPSHRPDRPRWRVFAPTSGAVQPEERYRLMARLNGALGGILAGESFTLSQAFYFGQVEGVPFETLATFDGQDGEFIDLLDELDEIAIGKREWKRTDSETGEIGMSRTVDLSTFKAEAQERGRKLRTGDGRRDMLKSFIGHLSGQFKEAPEIKADLRAVVAETFDPADPVKWRDIDALVDNITGKDAEVRALGARNAKNIMESAMRKAKVEEADDGAGQLRPVSIADVLTNPQPPHPFIWGQYLPAEANTLLSGHGGDGKSGFALQLSAHIAMGRPFLGFPVLQTQVLFFSAEDAASVLRLRLAAICRNHDIDPAELARHLHVLDATDAAVLWQSDGRKPGEPTANYSALGRYIEEHRVGFVIVDNSSDTYSADRTDKSQVTQFTRALVRLVRKQGGGSLLLAHVNRATAAAKSGHRRSDGGESYSDSVAWHNSSRSRLFLEASEDGHALTLVHEKNNYGPRTAPLSLRRMGGCGMEVDSPDAGAADERKREDAAEVAQAVRAALGVVEYVPAAPSGPNTAYSAIENADRLPGWASKDKKRFNRALTAAVAARLLVKEEHKRSNRTRVEVLKPAPMYGQHRG
jgi:hypothetical protein